MKKTLILLVAVLLSGYSLAEDVSDPWENWNRKVFAFNEVLDRALLKPVAKGYQWVTPDPVEKGIGNMFSNFGEVLNIVNDLLQGKLAQAGNDSGRLLINSTIGVAGFFEVAEKMGLPKSDGEDFDQTLAVWGVPSGNYLMLPFLGPTTVRGAPSRYGDIIGSPSSYVDHVPTRNSLYGTFLISTRASLLDREGFISGDKYLFIRDVFLQRREYLINDGQVEDDFGGYGEDDYGGYDEDY